ncbi:MAG: ATP-binding cassette domain-containing protein [Chloroflexi bacterium]|nr:ATP-binding cassette domain-containing protein [Chloroflexota bacterium]
MLALRSQPADATPALATDGPHVEVRDLAVRRAGRIVLEVPSLTLRRGEILVVVGPNGAGKSTLAGALALLDRPASGEICLGGTPVDWRRGALAARRRLAMVFQEPLLFDTTVFDNVATGLKLRGLGRREVEARVHDWLVRLGIGHLARRQARTLSGGESQRTSLARALVVEPELLMLDEPFAALDPPTREALTDDLAPLLRERQTTTVLVTHDRDEALTFGDRLAVIVEGRIVQIGRPEEVAAAPASPIVEAFVRPRRRAFR